MYWYHRGQEPIVKSGAKIATKRQERCDHDCTPKEDMFHLEVGTPPQFLALQLKNPVFLVNHNLPKTA